MENGMPTDKLMGYLATNDWVTDLGRESWLDEQRRISREDLDNKRKSLRKGRKGNSRKVRGNNGI